MIWKINNRLISAGEIIIRKDPRFVLQGYNLTITGVRVKDEGEYICQVETSFDPIQQQSLLSVLIPASVEPVAQTGNYDHFYFVL